MNDMTVGEFLNKSKETLNLIEPFKSAHRNRKDINIVFSDNSHRTREFKVKINSNTFSGYDFYNSNINSMFVKDSFKDSVPIPIGSCKFKSAEIIEGMNFDELNELFIVFEIPK